MPVGSPRPGIQLQSPKTNDEDVERPGGRAVPHLFRVRTRAISPTLCQQHSAAGDDHGEQGQHVHRHASERLGCRRFGRTGDWTMKFHVK